MATKTTQIASSEALEQHKATIIGDRPNAQGWQMFRDMLIPGFNSGYDCDLDLLRRTWASKPLYGGKVNVR